MATVFINEIHYDNAGTDVGEFVEIAGVAGTDLAGWTLVLYNGLNGTTYGTTDLSTYSIDDEGNGFGAFSVPTNGLQNGSPDGIALVNNGTVVQFLSYEGSFTGVGGAANGLTSTDIGVSQTTATPIGLTLQLTGTGTQSGDFGWNAPSDDSPGTINVGQTFTGGGGTAPTVNLTVSSNSGSEVAPADITVTATASSAVASDQTVTLTVTGTGITTGDYTLNNTTANTATITILSGQTTGTATFKVVDDALVEGAETATLTLSNPSSGIALGSTITQNIAIADNDTAVTKIHDIQGSNTTFNTAFSGVQTIEGIVTRSFTGSTKLNGFYVQEEDADADTNAATSEAIFVFDTFGSVVNIGDKVRVTGTVKEFTSATASLTEIETVSAASVVNLGASTLPTITNVQLPSATATDLERYEGMLINLSAATGSLTVTENFQLGRFGQVVLAANGTGNQPGTDARFEQYTQFNSPSVSGYSAYLADIAKRRIYLDDGSNSSNLDPILFGRGGNPLSATNTLRSGDTVASITGVLDERFEGYRIQTATPVNFTATNDRPITPPTVGGSLKVASFNVLNYFTDLDTNTVITAANGLSFEPRGANTATEFTRQRDKIIQAIINSGADVLGLNEIENNGYGSTSAIQNLVDGLNVLAGAGTYSFITPGTGLGTDAITVGMIYKTAKVTPLGAAATMPNGYGSGAFDTVGRKPLAQTFTETATGGNFTLVANHFKSKGSSSGGTGDADALDGQGFSNGTRTRQAQDLSTWLATKPTGTNDSDYLVLGDLNAYSKEDPLTTLAAAGYANLLPDTTYSYVFDGQTGSLDHALATGSLAAQVTGAAKWHINADEPTVLDYNTEFKTAGQVTSLYSPDQFRSSDHDPVVVGLNLTKDFNTIEQLGAVKLAVVNGNYTAIDTASNTSTPITYNGNPVGPASYPGWSVVGAERVGDTPTGEIEYMWKHNTNGRFWYSTNTNTGGYVAGTDLISKEVDFAQDFNGDGTIGAVAPTPIESNGTTTLSVNGFGRYVANNGGADVNILYANSVVGPTSYPGWTVVGAERVGDTPTGEIEYMWKHNTNGRFWYSTNTNNGGSVADTDLISKEVDFAQDFNGDGTIGAVAPTPIESNGTTALSVNGFGRYVANNGGADVNILYANSVVGLNTFPDWSVIGAEIIGAEVKAIWKNTNGQFWQSTNTDNGGIIAATDIGDYEFTFKQDFDNDSFIAQVSTAANDTFTGTAGKDAVVFKGNPLLSLQNSIGIDTINSLTVGGQDSIFLSKANFTTLTTAAGNPLAAADFGTVTTDLAAETLGNSIVYNSANGKLFYDANGAAAGFGAGGQFAQLAQLATGLSLTNADFKSIA